MPDNFLKKLPKFDKIKFGTAKAHVPNLLLIPSLIRNMFIETFEIFKRQINGL